MRVLLMHRDRDWDQEQSLTDRFRTFRREPHTPALSRHELALVQDLALDTLLTVMAGGDEFLFEAALRAFLSSARNDIDTIRYRQEIVSDCLKNPSVVRDLYAVVLETINGKRKHYISDYARFPTSVLFSALDSMQMFVGMLQKLRGIAATHAGHFESTGFTNLFAMLQREFSDEYFAAIQTHLSELKFREGVLLSAQLGHGNEGTRYALHRPRDDERSWLERLFGKAPPGYTFYIHERDEAGARALSELRDRGINLVANALAQSADHILGFFEMLRAELAFYIGCLNLHERLQQLQAPVSLPSPESVESRALRGAGLYDVCLALQTGQRVIANSINADGKSLLVVTGANQGGKSTFLRSVGVAQLMMQCGMFVGAEAFSADVCAGLWTHYKREEDATMTSGKLDEELARMSDIVDQIVPNSLLLLNESFAATNEREGSEIASQIVHALVEKRIKVIFVTHLVEFAQRMFDERRDDALFLRAERKPDGTRTFRIVPGEPLETSYGEDLYAEVFNAACAAMKNGIADSSSTTQTPTVAGTDRS